MENNIPTIFLKPSEVLELTHKKHHSAQARALRYMGIDFKIRPDGTIAILREYLEKALAGGTARDGKISKKSEPDWSAVNGKKA